MTLFHVVTGTIAALILGAWVVGTFRDLADKGITPVRILIVLGIILLIWG